MRKMLFLMVVFIILLVIFVVWRIAVVMCEDSVFLPEVPPPGQRSPTTISTGRELFCQWIPTLGGD